MSPIKYGTILFASIIVSTLCLKVHGGTITLQQGENGYNGCTDTYFSRNRVYETTIYGPFGDSEDLIIQGGT